MTFFEDMKDLEKCPSGRNEGSDHIVDSFPKSNQEEGIVDDLEDDEEQEEDLGDLQHLKHTFGSCLVLVVPPLAWPVTMAASSP